MKEVVTLDIDSRPIHEGDEVLVFPARYKTTLIEPGIYEEHRDSPLPTPDTPLAKGVVYWSEDMLAYWIKLNWVNDLWDPKPAAISMGGGCYHYQLTA